MRATTLASTTFWTLMAITAKFDLETTQIDAVNAFIHCDLNEVIYSAKTLVSRHEHKIAIVKIPTPRSRAYHTTMQHLFGTEISRNRRPVSELSEVARAGIIAVSEAGVSKLEIAVEYRVNWLTVYNTIN